MQRLNHAVIRNLYFIIFQNEPGAKATQVAQLKKFYCKRRSSSQDREMQMGSGRGHLHEVLP